MPQRVEEKIGWLDGQIWSKRTWLEDHSNSGKWPQHDIEAKQYGLTMLEDIRSDYALSIARAEHARAGQ